MVKRTTMTLGLVGADSTMALGLRLMRGGVSSFSLGKRPDALRIPSSLLMRDSPFCLGGVLS